MNLAIAVGDRLKRSFKRMEFRHFIDRIAHGNCVPALYLRQFPFLDFFEELRNDFHLPSCVPTDRHIIFNLWVGSSNTIQPFHKDNHDPISVVENIFTQVRGRKVVYLVSGDYDHCMYPRPQGEDDHFSSIDVENIDLINYPLFADVPLQVAEMGAGDMLYIPRNTWHYVRSLEPSISLSMWWHTFRAMDALLRLRINYEAKSLRSVTTSTQLGAGCISHADLDLAGGAAEIAGLLRAEPMEVREGFLSLCSEPAIAALESASI